MTTDYDPLDRVSLVTDPIGRKVKTVYDAAGQVVQVIKAFGSPLQQTYATTTYSPNGQALSVTDARGQITKTVYDGFDRSIKLLYPDATPANDNDNLFEAFSYDAGSRKLTETRRGGQVLTYGYDDLDRVTSRSGGGMPTRTFTYDVAGRGLSVKDMNGATIVAETQYTYDTAGRLTRERRNDWSLNVDYQLDANGNRTRITWPDAFYAAYVYDGAGRVASVATPTLTLRTYAYDHFSRRTGQTVTPGASQTATTYGYEIDSDLASLTHNYPGATLDLAYTHTTSAAGQLLSTTTSEPLNRYSPGTTLGTQTYASANPLNQYPSVTPIGGSATTLTYDLNGNLTGDGSSTYTYDATNRLLSIAGLVTASYSYDALDRRMQKTASATTTRYLHAGSDEIAEYTSAGALLRRYVPGPGADERAAMIDSGLASPPATSIKYAHTDRQGSVVSVTDSTGAVTERFAYDGFGRSSSALSGYPFRYTGQRLDFESGLMFYKARTYSTTLGRFLQTDPIGTKDDLNLYAYVGNDPINKTDPSGNAGWGGGAWRPEGWDDVDEALYQRDMAETGTYVWAHLPFVGPATSLYTGFAEPWRYDATKLKEEGGMFLGADVLSLGLASPVRGVVGFEEALSARLADAIGDFEVHGFTAAQTRAIAQRPQLAAAFEGERIHYYFGQRVLSDPALSELASVTPRFSYGPDVVYRGPNLGYDLWADVTTGKQLGQHLADYEDDFGESFPLLYK